METFTAYTNTRTDYLLVYLGLVLFLIIVMTISKMFSFVPDKKVGGELAPYLLNIFFMTVSLRKHTSTHIRAEVDNLSTGKYKDITDYHRQYSACNI